MSIIDWHDHKAIEGLHSMLSPSGYHWLNYDADRMYKVWANSKAKEDGTRLHETASWMIKYNIKPEDRKKAFNMFVRDAIGYGLDSEKLLFGTPYCFGTADAIGLYFDKDYDAYMLRIHDLKTGVSKPSFKQLYIYAALYCLEYQAELKLQKIKVEDIVFICRLYQGKGFVEEEITWKEVEPITKHILEMSDIIAKAEAERKSLGL